MILRNVDFGPIWGASGVQGFFGEGYWFHRWVPGLDFRGSTFVAKTTTLLPRQGNMPLTRSWSPKDWRPKCIVVRPFKGVVLNAVGLSGPGAEALFRDGRWQKRREPFFLSFMSVAETAEERLDELRAFVDLCEKELPGFRAPVGLQINFSCPNVSVHTGSLLEEVVRALAVASRLGIPLVPKLNALVPPPVAKKIVEPPACDALCVSNTIKWGQLPERILWKRLFGSDVSPLADLGGGGLSGAPLLPIVADWVHRARMIGITKPIVAGGGILQPLDIDTLVASGADSISIGSVAILRGWRVRSLIRHAKKRLDWMKKPPRLSLVHTATGT